ACGRVDRRQERGFRFELLHLDPLRRGDQLHVAGIQHRAVHGYFKREHRNTSRWRVGDHQRYRRCLRSRRHAWRGGIHRITSCTPAEREQQRRDSELAHKYPDAFLADHRHAPFLKRVRFRSGTELSTVSANRLSSLSSSCHWSVIPCAILDGTRTCICVQVCEQKLPKRVTSISEGRTRRAASVKTPKSALAAAAEALAERVFVPLEDDPTALENDPGGAEGDSVVASPIGDKVSMHDVFGTGGLLERCMIGGYEHRRAQLEMAELVHDAFENHHHAIVEAGTGTGKTLAYLLPAICSGRRVVISTATKSLQEQLFSKDIPFLQKHFAPDLKVAVMKGRSNFLCRIKAHQM